MFQHSAVCALSANKNVILTAPCGSGKFVIISLAIDALRIHKRNTKGVCLMILPLTSIMEELKNNHSDVAYITYSGELVTENFDGVTMSDSIEALTSGKYKLILLHCESATSRQSNLNCVFVHIVAPGLPLHCTVTALQCRAATRFTYMK